MLYKEELTNKSKIIRPLLERLVEKGIQNQSHKQDFFLILINGFYDENLFKNDLSPFVFGSEWTHIAEESFSDYMKWYINHDLFSKQKKVEIQYPNPELEIYKISIHTEKSIYLRFWEAETTLQYLYQITRLCNGLPFDWKWKQKIAKYKSRQEFFRENIKKPIEKIDRNIYDFLNNNVIGQIRNAIAHSQYCVLNNGIKYLNYSDDPKKFSSIMMLNYTEWGEIIHNTFVFRNELVKLFNALYKGYQKYAELEGGTLELRIVKESENVEFGRYELRK
jgi:hypothetical protein